MQAPPPEPPPGGYGFVPPPPGSPPPPPPSYGYPAAAFAAQPYAQVSYAGFWIRAAGYVIDSIAVTIASFVLFAVIGFVAALGNPNAALETQSATFNASVRLVSVLISFSYFVGMWTMNGATFGQRILGLRVVDASTLQPIGPGTAIVRWIGLLLSFLLCFAGVIWVAFDSRKQGLLDKLANTVVVHG